MQRLTLTVGFIGLLIQPAFAQTTGRSITSPTGLEKAEGSLYSTGWAARTGKFQHIEGDFRGSSRVLTALQFRRDMTLTTGVVSVGRSFALISCQLSDSDFPTATNSFAKNQTSVPTTVWSSTKFSLPGISGIPNGSKPSVWGGATGEYNFRFSKNWMSSAAKDFAVTWDFQGLKLANGNTSIFGSSYFLDGEQANTFAASATVRHLPSAIPPACYDSAMTNTFGGARMLATATLYGSKITQVNYRDKLLITTSTFRTAPLATVVHALGFSNPSGTVIGARCNPLFLNPAAAIFSVSFSTQTTGNSGYYHWLSPWLPVMRGLPLAGQGAWTDSRTGLFSLTSGVEMTLPQSRPRSEAPRRAAVYSYGSVVYVLKTNTAYVPVTRYLHK